MGGHDCSAPDFGGTGFLACHSFFVFTQLPRQTGLVEAWPDYR
jgi:hypothetical protein